MTVSIRQAAEETATMREPLHDGAVEHDLLATLEPLGRRGRLFITALLAICGIALIAWVVQLTLGLRVTAMRDYVSWGAYMTNFVFFIGISHAGTLISAILRVTDAGWRRPITRMAEAITVFALMVGAPMVIIDMGRPDRLMNVFAHGRFQSPILWDVCSITTYLTGSILYLYVAMIPDMTILARRARARGGRFLERLYGRLSLGYRDTPEQRRRLNLALGAMAVIIIPVAVSVHTVVSWVFGMTVRPGWHSTIFGPYFVIGAIYSGTAAIITAMAVFRRAYRLEHYLRPEHFRHLAKLLLALTLLYGYFTLAEYLTVWYGGLEAEGRLLELLAGRSGYGTAFWLWGVAGLLVPGALLLFPSRRSLTAIVTASVLINIGMWVKRYLIIVPTLQTPFIPAEATGIEPGYFPSLVEWAITAGALAAFALLFTLFSRLFPILSIWETAEDEASRAELAAQRAAPVRHSHRVPAAVVAVMTAAGLSALAVPSAAHAMQAEQPVRIEVQRATEDSSDVLVATVTKAGRPVVGALAGFYVERSLGWLLLGEDRTLEDGTAAVDYPVTLPAGPGGDLRVRVGVLEPDELAGVTFDTVLPAATMARISEGKVSRALWAARAPIPMLVTLAVLLVAVWSTYAFVVAQLWGIRRHPKEE